MPRRKIEKPRDTISVEREEIRRRPPAIETPPMLVNDISHLFVGKIRSKETTDVMSQPSARLILRMLSNKDGIRQNDIAAATHLSAPTVSITLKRMEKEGLIRRESFFHDLRAVNVFLTEAGREYDRKIHTQFDELSDAMMKGFSPEETEMLLSLLLRMRGNLLQQFGDGCTPEQGMGDAEK